MNRLRVAVSLAALALVPCVGAQSNAQPSRRIDWPAFLGRHDLVWKRTPARWGESAFIGNGALGATVFAEDSVLGWTINRTDVVHDQSRFPIGRVFLKTRGAQHGGSARLELWNAEASGEVATDSGSVRWRSYVSTAPSVIVIELEGRGDERSVELGWTPAEARPPRKVARKEAFAPEDLHPAASVAASPLGITSVQSFIGGDAHAEWIRRGANTGGRRVFYVSIGKGGTGDEALGDARRAADAAVTAGEPRLTTRHRAWWHEYYPASFLSFPDARLEGYYWIQMYKLGSAMRENGPILDLNGPWFSATPWPAIWWNLNIQLTYSPLFKANRIPLSESLFRNLDRNQKALIENVPERLRADAAAIGRSSGPDLVRKVDLATATSDAALEAGNLPWTMYYYWQYHRYTMDDALLRARVYPLLSRAIGNYLGYVEKGADGKYHLPKTHSPELASMPDANYDLALLRWGLETLISSAGRLHIVDPHLSRWRDVLANLTPFPQDSTGLLVGKDRPWKESHRHYSHLLSIYPLGLVTPDKPEDRALIEKSLATWESVPAAFRGYSYTGSAAMHAMLGHGDASVLRMNKYLDAPRYMEPNTFYAEAGPVIETPLAAAATLQELLLQDWGGAIRVFHGTPSAWKEASFDKLRTDGAFLVSAVRHGGHTAWVRVESLAGEKCRVVVDDWQSAVVRAKSGPRVKLTSTKPTEFGLEIPAGGWVVLALNATSPLPALAPVALDPSEFHRWPAPTDTVRVIAAPVALQAGVVAVQDRPDMAWWRASMASRDSRMGWFREARFGMFIHWGVYSQLAGVWNDQPVKGYAEHIQRIMKIPAAEYKAKAVDQFNPVNFNADEWIATAKRAGMGYMIITSKHHDGFAMYDSKASDYNIVKATPFHRDPLRELRDAARRQGVRFGFYYSHAFDWGDPDGAGNDWEYDNPGGDLLLHGGRDWWEKEPDRVAKVRRYVDRKAIPQVRELIARYDPDIMWFDTPGKLPPEENLRVLRAAREAKPTLIINGRAVQAVPGGPEARFGDYANTSDRPLEIIPHDGDWEAIPTTNESYGYHRLDLSHKAPEHFIGLLAKAAARGGNLLLNIGPRGDGTFDPKDVAILDGVGRWMAVNGESIHGTSRSPLPVQLWGQSTYKGNRLYLHVLDWPAAGKLRVSGIRAPVFSARLLARPGSAPLEVKRLNDADVEITVPRTAIDPWDTVIVLEAGVPPEIERGIWLRSAGAPMRLHVFDGSISGAGIGYGDGKRSRDVVQGWTDTSSTVSWTVRLTEPARMKIALDYATPATTKGGSFEVTAGGQRLAGRVQLTANESTFAEQEVGFVTLGAGTYVVTVRPTTVEGGELMRLRNLVLAPLSAEITRQQLIDIERHRVIEQADRYLLEQPVTITSTRAERSAGGLHDFYSEGDYWWPDPADSSKPYIRRDGETNPANFEAHRSAMRRLSQIVPALVAAYEITGDARYARRAIEHLRAWFVDEGTRMNPSMLYAQAIKGVATGRGIGIIDAIHLVEVAQAALELERLGALSGPVLADTRSWFRQYVEWMTTHKYGIEERDNGNNHSAAWALQVAAFSRFTGDTAKLAEMRTFFREKLIPGQMAPDGSFPRELARTKPYGYSLFQLDVMGMLTEALSTPRENMWTFATPDGRGMRKAMEYMAPFIRDKSRWTLKPDVMYFGAWPVRHPALLFAGRALHEPSYVALWKTLDPDPTVDEVVRNYPVRQPLLWVQ